MARSVGSNSSAACTAEADGLATPKAAAQALMLRLKRSRTDEEERTALAEWQRDYWPTKENLTEEWMAELWLHVGSTLGQSIRASHASSTALLCAADSRLSIS